MKLKLTEIKNIIFVSENKTRQMTATAIRKKVHKYIDEADTPVLEVVCKMLEVYRKTNASYLTEEQQAKALETAALYKAEKMKGYSLAETRKRVKQRLAK